MKLFKENQKGEKKFPDKRIYPNGDIFEGTIEQGKFNGEGCYISKSTGDIFEGIFKENHKKSAII